VLTAGGLLNPDKSRMARQLIKRYSRLMLPVLAASMLVLLLMLGGLTANEAAGQVVGRGDWLGSWLWFPPEWRTMLGFSLFAVFLDERDLTYGPFLWTMTIELWGSFLVLGLCLLEARLRRPALVLAGLGALFLVANAPWSGFFFGALIALGHREGWLPRGQGGRWTAVLAVLAFACVLLLAGVAVWAAEPTAAEHAAIRFLCAAVAPVAVVAMCWSAPVARAFASPLSRFLGRVSFPVYLMHFPVLVSLSSFLILAAEGAHLLTLPVAAGIAIFSLAASLFAATAFLPVEWGTARFGRWLERFVETRPAAPAAVPTPAE
jgi:peptidoglycan/LPS O-acetylase OafA/YrhL